MPASQGQFPELWEKLCKMSKLQINYPRYVMKIKDQLYSSIHIFTRSYPCYEATCYNKPSCVITC